MNIEELAQEYSDKLENLKMEFRKEFDDKFYKLKTEYEEKAKELTEEKEEPFIKKGQMYFYIDEHFNTVATKNYDCEDDKGRISTGNCYPYTYENGEEVLEKVRLISERRRLKSEMELFAKQNNDGEIDWSDSYEKWYLYLDCNNSQIGIDIAYDYRIFNSVYFTSEEIAEKALIKFEDRIRKLYLDAEE